MYRQKQDENGQSAWKRLELENRSTSFPAAVSLQNSLVKSEPFHDPYDRRKNEREEDNVASWMKTLHGLTQNTISLSSPPRDIAGRLKRKTGDIESNPLSPLRIPVLTMTMIKLHDVFGTFCRHLSDTTFSKAQAACLVLDSHGMVASPKASQPNSPASIMDSPSSHKSSSPSRSPITSWFSGSYASQSEYSQKSEWEKACNPLIIFAGLETIYSSCSHVESHIQALTLVRLYRRTNENLLLLRKALCDPFVHSAKNELSPGTNSISSHRTKAMTLSLSIEAIMSLCDSRCKLIEQHVRLCSSEDIDVEKVVASFQVILHSMPKEAAKSKSIVDSVKREVEGWCNIMKIFCSFREYRFMNTIVGCQQMKLKLKVSSDNLIQKWICNVYQSFVSMLPVYFESLDLDIISRYGYQESSFHIKYGENTLGQNVDLESKLEEFMRFEERTGAPFAIAVVASVAGFRVHRSVSNCGWLNFEKDKASSTRLTILEHSDVLAAYPAVCIRTRSDNSFSGKILGARRNSAKKDVDYDHGLEKNKFGDVNSKLEMNFWPYTSWNSIIPVLKNTNQHSSDDNSVPMDWSQVDSDTSICASRLDNDMWLVAMKKTNDDSRWNRRNDEERTRKERELFSDLSTSLRLRDVFKSSLALLTSVDIDPVLNELSNTMIGNRLLENENTSQLLESFKKIFGLRSPIRHGTHSRNPSGTLSPKVLKGLHTWSSPLPSHFTFFLGSHLMDSLREKE